MSLIISRVSKLLENFFGAMREVRISENFQKFPSVFWIGLFRYHNKSKQIKTKNEKMRNASTFLRS